MLPLLAHIYGVRTKLFSSKPRRKMTANMINKQAFFTQNLAPTISFPYNTAAVRHINPKLPGKKRQGALSWKLQSKRSTKDGRLITARALSSPRPSVLGRVFKSGAITIELDEINSWNFIHKCHGHIKSISQNKNDNPSFIGSWVINMPLVKIVPRVITHKLCIVYSRN